MASMACSSERDRLCSEPCERDSQSTASCSTYANPIWSFYSKLSEKGAARCEACGSILKTPTGTTTTLVTHLKRHPGKYKAYQVQRQRNQRLTTRKDETKPNSSQSSVATVFKPKLQPTAPKAKEMTKKIATFIARAFQPYSVVEDESFIDMIRYAIPEYVVPSRKTFSRTVIPDLYAAKKSELKKRIRAIFEGAVECYTLTTDGWTSRAGDSYVCVTVHVLDEDFVQHVYALACKEMPEEHTAENVLRFLRTVVEEWDLPDNIPIFVVTDNARNFVSAVARSPWLGLQCFAHTLQLCINDAKKEVAIFSQLCAKARCIVGHYKRSARARGRLIEIQKDMHMNALEVVQDVSTRWNSEHSMMERLVKLRAPISAELSESDSVENLSTKEWKLMAAVVKVLQPLQQATAELSADRYPTLSQSCTQSRYKVS
ncbi:zinc finger BED domain-containing protein 4-like [Ixodes scapularis]|uniref:zinc finger BED domain-containing protein 4-like n=1 Tax=Ixodes scapularis TaxID=6945 RepID=UPI001A9D7E10|nr:zinc finger BED domain-containing protein 4-like [Ixodes scapularis]